MVKIQDRDFFDTIYTGFTNTTRAADAFWMPEEDTKQFAGGDGTWNVFAVDQTEARTFIASFDKEVDAGFLCTLHGALPDLVRRLHAALDEADRADREHDEREQEIGRLSMENMELHEENDHLSRRNVDLVEEISAMSPEVEELKNALATAKAENSYHRPLG